MIKIIVNNIHAVDYVVICRECGIIESTISILGVCCENMNKEKDEGNNEGKDTSITSHKLHSSHREERFL